MKGENETEPSFVHSATPMNKGKVKDEWEKQFFDISGIEQNFYNAKQINLQPSLCQSLLRDVSDESKPSFHKLFTASCLPVNREFTKP